MRMIHAGHGDPRRWIERSTIWPEVAASAVLETLRDYDAVVAGSWPIGIALAGADVDVICNAPSLERFASHCRSCFQHLPSFVEEQADTDPREHLCRFASHGLIFEIFGQARPVARQNAYRHMLVEARLLALGGEDLRRRVLARKCQGANSEAAFASALGLVGDPFQTLLLLEQQGDEKLTHSINIHSHD